jgi:hypothetical protein
MKEKSMSKFDPTKPVQTRDGRKARILCTNAVGTHPIIAAVNSSDGVCEYPIQVQDDGKVYSGESKSDLVNVPQEITIWFNVYYNPVDKSYYIGAGTYKSKKEAVEDYRDLANYVGSFSATIKE